MPHDIETARRLRGQWVTYLPKRGRRLKYSHFSPLSGQPDKPENYHTVTIEPADEDGETKVSLSQDNNADETAREHSEKNWGAMLQGLKKYVEKD